MGKGQELYRKARTLIPGGTQLLSKRPEMFLPEQWPAYYSKAAGAQVWDLDGRSYYDFSHCAVGTCTLGFGDPDVDAAVQGAIAAGNMSTLNAPEEVELAELLVELHPWAEMARFARCGGEVLAVAIRIARASTKRDKIAFCGYHGWQDWYLAANLGESHALDGHLLKGLEPAGVPRGLRGTMLPFHYDNLDELEAIVKQHGNELAAIVMEPARSAGPAPGFLEGVRAIATKIGAVLIFDEVTSGLRVNTGGIHLTYGVSPDLATFAKALGNGYPMAAVIGRRGVMDSAQSSFISSTYWTDRIGPTAALATLRKHRKLDAGSKLTEIGQRVQRGWRDAGQRAGLEVHVDGIAPLGHFEIKYKAPAAAATLFTQKMLERGFLASTSLYATLAHTPDLVGDYLQAVEATFTEIAASIAKGAVESDLRGPVKHSGFQRLT